MPAKPSPRARSSSTSFALPATLDARRDRLDLRDLPYRAPLCSLPDRFPAEPKLARFLASYVKAGLVLDQGKEGACTGFGLACVINYLLWTKPLLLAQGTRPAAKARTVSARMLYHLARLYDEWPGEDYDGSSCRGALKGWHKHGVCSEDLWPYRDSQGRPSFVPPKQGWDRDAVGCTLGVYCRVDKNSIVDMQAAIFEIGALYASADVHAGWAVPPVSGAPSFARLPIIDKKQDTHGGHAFALVGYDERGFVVQNSWGRGWGLGGFALLTYEDWADNGYDAWGCALGVPKNSERTAAPLVQVPSPTDAALRRRGTVAMPRAERVDAEDGRLSIEQAYQRTLVLGNDGYVERRVVTHADAADTVAKLGHDLPDAWFSARAASQEPEHLLLYAHGGLNSEDASIARIRALGKVFEENGIYPLFLTWRTGVQDTIRGIVEDELTALAGPAGGLSDWLEQLKEATIEAKDRAIEVTARELLVRAIWEQMKQNAAAAAIAGRGGERLASAIKALRRKRGSRLRVHLVGHSAGAIILGHLLEHLPDRIASCTLYAPACTVAFANEHYVPAVAKRKQIDLSTFAIDVLSDGRERADSVGPYGKSLLYLVSRALEVVHKTPILGLHCAFDPEFNTGKHQWNAESPALQAQMTRMLTDWQAFWNGSAGVLKVELRESVPTGLRPDARNIPAVHGCFDNHADVIHSTMRRILGKEPPRRPLDLDY